MSLNPPNPPQVPNYQDITQQQTSANVGAGTASQAGSLPNQTNQYGSVTHNQIGTDPNTGVPLYATNTNLSPVQQGLFDTLMGTKGAAGAGGRNLITGANYGGVSPTNAIGDMTSGLTKQMLDKEVSYLNPYFQTNRDQLDTKLRNQGLFPGTPGYDVAMRGLDTTQSGTVQDFLAKSQGQAFGQAKSLYEEPASLGSALAGIGAPGDPTQNLVNTAGLDVKPANVVGAAANMTQGQMEQYKAEQAKYASTMQGLFGIPTAVLGGWARGGFPGTSAVTSMFG